MFIIEFLLFFIVVLKGVFIVKVVNQLLEKTVHKADDRVSNKSITKQIAAYKIDASENINSNHVVNKFINNNILKS